MAVIVVGNDGDEMGGGIKVHWHRTMRAYKVILIGCDVMLDKVL